MLDWQAGLDAARHLARRVAGPFRVRLEGEVMGFPFTREVELARLPELDMLDAGTFAFVLAARFGRLEVWKAERFLFAVELNELAAR